MAILRGDVALSEQFLHASVPVNPLGDSIASSSTPLIVAGGGRLN